MFSGSQASWYSSQTSPTAFRPCGVVLNFASTAATASASLMRSLASSAGTFFGLAIVPSLFAATLLRNGKRVAVRFHAALLFDLQLLGPRNSYIVLRGVERANCDSPEWCRSGG